MVVLQTNAKVLKDVKFPMLLDLCDICTPALQEKMRPYRDAVKVSEMSCIVSCKTKSHVQAEEDAKIERLRQKKMEGRDADVDDEKDGGVALPFSFEDDPGSNNSGFYQLQVNICFKTFGAGFFTCFVLGCDYAQGSFF